MGTAAAALVVVVVVFIGLCGVGGVGWGGGVSDFWRRGMKEWCRDWGEGLGGG